MRCAEKIAAAYRLGHDDALDDVQDALQAIPAPYKVKGQYETYGPYNEGASDLKDAALSAIDNLRKP
jgi:hypothetical protein